MMKMRKRLENQLLEVRTNKHKKFISSIKESPIPNNDIIVNGDDENLMNKSTKIWQKDTTLIVGDSLISGLVENRMGVNVMVRSFPGRVIKDFYNYLIPLQHY